MNLQVKNLKDQHAEKPKYNFNIHILVLTLYVDQCLYNSCSC